MYVGETMYTITLVDNDHNSEHTKTYDNFKDFRDALEFYGACWDGKQTTLY